ncbi:MAG: peptide chain release factor N(5)-glutamine methyltransferase [Muribaculaceae bacterium]
MTVTELKNEILKQLTPTVGAGEATAMMREMLFRLKKYSPADIVIYGDRSVLDQSVELAREWTRRVVAGEPLQYVLGIAHFMGMELSVTPAVLIPRPETSQLVDMITDAFGARNSLSVLDIGTGSGCIAIALARALTYPDVTAVDISEPALDVARENARNLHANINFIKADALNLSLPGHFDVIVSNPPYIAMGEKKNMDSRVYAHEPASALFVPDADPLEFYRAIGRFAIDALNPQGALFFEINPLFSTQLNKMLVAQGWHDVQIIRDYKGNYRFAICRL